MAPSASQVLNAVKAAGVRYILQPGWDDPANAAGGTWNPNYVILHHTANGGATGNTPSLAYVTRGTYSPVRNCHFLIGRDGLVAVVYALKCYHAGMGGPGRWGDGPLVPLDSMNNFAYGIEIESKGTSTTVDATNGYTQAQIEATSKLTAELLKMMGRNTGCAINHRTWAPLRKTDTLLTDASWQARINPYMVTQNPGDDMALDQADIDKVAHAVWNKVYPDPTDGKDASTASLLLRARIDSHTAATRPFPTTSLSDAQINAIADAVVAALPPSSGLTQGDYDAIATRVADLLAQRLSS